MYTFNVTDFNKIKNNESGKILNARMTVVCSDGETTSIWNDRLTPEEVELYEADSSYILKIAERIGALAKKSHIELAKQKTETSYEDLSQSELDEIKVDASKII